MYDYNEDGTKKTTRLSPEEYLAQKNEEYIAKLTPKQLAQLDEYDDIMLDGGRVWANYGRARLYTHGGYFNLDNGQWTDVIEEDKLYGLFDEPVTLTLPGPDAG